MMEMKVHIPFQQFLTAVRALTPLQKERLKQELTEEKKEHSDNAVFIEMLLHGPVLSEQEIQIIEENRKSIAKWHTQD
jgi:hypothetical protein